MNLSGTFDTTYALSCMFLWLIFGFLTTMVNCDIQRFLKTNPIVFHCFGFIAFFFLFTLLDTNNKQSIGIIWLKSLVIYILFVLMTKSKWYFVLPIMALLLIDQSIKKQVAFKEANNENVENFKKIQSKITQVINIVIVVLIVIGVIDYIRLQRIEYKGKFSFYKFFITTNTCKEKALNYDKI